MIKAHCLSCSNVFSGFSVWDYDDLVCECGSTELEIYSDKKLILSRNSKICERCQIKYLPQNWLDLKKKNLCVDCIELPAIQSIQTSQEKAEVPQHLKKCPFGHDTVLRENSINGSKFIGCSRFPHCRWTARLED